VVFTLLISCTLGQQLYPHLPETGPSEEGPTMRAIAYPTPQTIYTPTQDSLSLEIYIRQLSIFTEWILDPNGTWVADFAGDFAGHFWAIIDLNPNYNPVPAHITIPNLYHNYYAFDYDIIMNEELHWTSPVQPPAGMYWYNFWFSQTATGQVAESISLFPDQAASVVYDAFGGGYADIPIARFVYPAIFQGTWIQIHVIGNMWHEIDGQGWFYMSAHRLL
jgi:hypothetical protein